MIDPLTAFAAVKGGITAGKQLHQLSKEIASFFDSVDHAKKAHANKKNSALISVNEEAMATWQAKQDAEDMENQLRELICRTRGHSHYQDLLKIRREIRVERQKRERQMQKEKEEFQETVAIVMVSLLLFGLAAVSIAIYFELLDPRRMF